MERTAVVHLGLIVLSYSSDESVQIPSLALLANGLGSRIDVTIFPLRNPDGAPQVKQDNPAVIDLCGSGLRFRSLAERSISVIRERHRTFPLDVLHAYWLFEPGAVAALAGRVLNIPVVASIGGAELASIPAINYGGNRSRRGRIIHWSILRTARIITGGSQYILNQAAAAMPGSAPRLRLAPLPVAIDGTSTASAAESSERTAKQRLLQVGAYLPVKGQDISIRALAALSKTHPDATLTCIGEDPASYRLRVHDLASSLGISDRVRLLERMPQAELTPHYRQSALLLMPSRHESQGMVVLEAAAVGLATIGSRVGVVGDLAPEAAVAVSPDNHLELASRVSELLSDVKYRQALGANARRRIENAYAVDPVISRWIAIYEEARRRA